MPTTVCRVRGFPYRGVRGRDLLPQGRMWRKNAGTQRVGLTGTGVVAFTIPTGRLSRSTFHARIEV